MPSIEYHGIEFTFLEDGSLDDVDLVCRDEFMACHADDFGECRFDEGFSDDAMCDWARDHLADDAWKRTGERGWPQWKMNGCPSPWGNA
jgi:hypothetical protein